MKNESDPESSWYLSQSKSPTPCYQSAVPPRRHQPFGDAEDRVTSSLAVFPEQEPRDNNSVDANEEESDGLEHSGDLPGGSVNL